MVGCVGSHGKMVVAPQAVDASDGTALL